MFLEFTRLKRQREYRNPLTVLLLDFVLFSRQSWIQTSNIDEICKNIIVYKTRLQSCVYHLNGYFKNGKFDEYSRVPSSQH